MAAPYELLITNKESILTRFEENPSVMKRLTMKSIGYLTVTGSMGLQVINYWWNCSNILNQQLTNG